MEWVLLSEASSWDNSISLTYVFIMSFFIFTSNKMSDPVVLFFHSRGKEILGMMFLAKSICVTRENKWKLLPIFGHYGLDVSQILYVPDYSDLAARGGRAEGNVFLNCIGWDFWLFAIFEIIGYIFGGKKKGFLERNFSMFQKMRGGIRKQKMRAGCGNVQKNLREKPANCR